MEITLEYWIAMANQMILISSLLSGFSITVVANLLVSDKNDKLTNRILKSATLSAGCFLITVFSMVQISMIITPGGTMKDVVENDFMLPRLIGMSTFMFGLVSLAIMISLSGWTKSKKVGLFTTAVGILTLILIFTTMIKIGF